MNEILYSNHCKIVTSFFILKNPPSLSVFLKNYSLSLAQRKLLCMFEHDFDSQTSGRDRRVVQRGMWVTMFILFLYLFFIFYMQVARHTRPEGHFKVWATIVFSRGLCYLLLGLKQGYPFYSLYRCRLGYHQSEARAESTTSPILYSKCHDGDSNPHSADQTPELESGPWHAM